MLDSSKCWEIFSYSPEDPKMRLCEALQLLRPSQDYTWHAATLEGLATVSVIEAWSAGNGLVRQVLWCYQRLNSFSYSAKLDIGVKGTVDRGWGPLAFTTMLQPGPKPYLPPTLSRDENNWASLERLSSISGISRSSIAGVLSQIHGPWLLHLGPRERIAILEATSSVYACLGYRRKEAYILREVIGCILDLMVCGREEDGLSRMSSVPGTSGLGIHGLSSSGGGSWSGVGVRMSESSDGNSSILELLKYVCKILGINLEAVKLVDVTPTESEHSVAVDESGLSSHEDYDNAAVAGNDDPHGWPELQVGVVREAVAVAEALPGIAPILTGGTDPFLYNPRKVLTGQGQTLVVQNETLEFIIVLQNPYIFDLELQSLSLR
ncbi:hypothetical protein H0H81_000383 [Sphagnurus paluster]|uniref:Uncharacterized protein n=1 Tax=Sphagnurus paluster TaxID=117069 RepID=A0A9P7FTM8_9AGAR|nr:hypothetical protein H0H81_000383 [Sphagnurus paluster]